MCPRGSPQKWPQIALVELGRGVRDLRVVGGLVGGHAHNVPVLRLRLEVAVKQSRVVLARLYFWGRKCRVLGG